MEENQLIKAFREISFEFRQLMKTKQGDQLQDWCKKALHSGVEALKGFVTGIKEAGGVPHFKAIFQTFTSKRSNSGKGASSP